MLKISGEYFFITVFLKEKVITRKTSRKSDLIIYHQPSLEEFVKIDCGKIKVEANVPNLTLEDAFTLSFFEKDWRKEKHFFAKIYELQSNID